MFKLKAKVLVHKQYDWRFYFKLIVAILPILSTVIFLIAQSTQIFGPVDVRADYWNKTLGIGTNTPIKVKKPITDLTNMTHGQAGAYLFCRNILMITTLGNILNAAWFINSACNNKYEGQGRWDNQVFGTMSISIIVFIVLFYNLSLIPSHGILNHMHWYNWMSWMTEHMFPDLAMMVYFFVAYPKRKARVIKGDNKLSEWFAEMGISISFVVFMNIFFIVLGYSLRAGHATRVFGEMSYTGYFPYPFYNFLNENKQAVGGAHSWVKPWMEFVVVMIIQLAEQVISFMFIHQQNKWQERIEWQFKPTFWRAQL